jgi:hypothetical protein
VVTEDAKEGHSERIPVQPLLGLILGLIFGVIHPGFLFFLFPTFIIPALIALVLQISPRTRPLAVGFGAASVGWLVYSIAFFVFIAVESALR